MRKLGLRKELLTELTVDQMHFVGANADTTGLTYSCVTACGGGNSCVCSIAARCTNTCGCGALPATLICLE